MTSSRGGTDSFQSWYNDIINDGDYINLDVYDKGDFSYRLSWLFGYPVSAKRACRLYTL